MKQPGEILKETLDNIQVAVHKNNLSELLYTAHESALFNGDDGVTDATIMSKLLVIAQSYPDGELPDQFKM